MSEQPCVPVRPGRGTGIAGVVGGAVAVAAFAATQRQARTAQKARASM